MVGNVGWNEMNVWEDFYHDVMGFANLITFDDKDISTQYTALMSKVMTNGNGRINFPPPFNQLFSLLTNSFINPHGVTKK